MVVKLEMEQSQMAKPKKVKVIQPRKKISNSHINKSVHKKRVGAYCRVSTDSDEQELSFETQCHYYQQYIQEHPDYELVDIYADEGISGTSLNGRHGFKRMMDDAKAGKLDLILTKSITRFARNTVDSLNSLRQLHDLGVEVYFEMEHINSREGNELLITILSSLAQESSHEKSNSVKWGYRRQFEKGKVYASNLYGYRSDHGTLVIVEEEAKIVREIFAMYLRGSSDREIANNLTERGILTRAGKNKWHASTIKGMLTNVKYTGNSICGKTYNVDFLHPKRLTNHREAPMFIIENSHPAIISKEIFEKVRVERARRLRSKTEMKGHNVNNTGRFSSVNSLYGKIICAECVSLYRRTVWTKRSGEKEPVWRCSNRLDYGRHAHCNSITLKEKALFEKLTDIINEMVLKKKDIIEEVSRKVSEYVNPKDIVDKRDRIKNELNHVNDQISRELENGTVMLARGVKDPESQKEYLTRLYDRKRKLHEELELLDVKLSFIREAKNCKTLQTLQEMRYPVSNLTKEEISVFIKEIVVNKNEINVLTTDNQTYKFKI